MLIEIKCDLFEEKTITFHPSLNVVVGDENGANSIGKSTLLMVVDFVFGGETFLSKNGGVIAQLGHHKYFSCFRFRDEFFRFQRSTDEPKTVWICDETYKPLNSITIDQFNALLKREYLSQSAELSFRLFVGKFCRVWGKDNVNHPDKPLHSVASSSGSDSVNDLLKMFDAFQSLSEMIVELDRKKTKRTTLVKASKVALIPDINKRKFDENKNGMEQIQSEITSIKDNLAKFALNISEIVSRDVMDMKVKKDQIIQDVYALERRLQRVRQNLLQNKHLKSKNLDALQDFFPNSIDIDRVATIEEFHSKIATLLKQELKKQETELDTDLSALKEDLAELDAKISTKLSSIDNPSDIVDRVYDLATSWGTVSLENKYFSEKENLKSAITTEEASLQEAKMKALSNVESLINGELDRIIAKVYGAVRKRPILSLSTEGYQYKVLDDTGTGKAYSSLLAFDLSIFKLTSLPIIIHDSILFKNIENTAVAAYINLYLEFEKQSFIAIDEIQKYGDSAKTIEQSKIITLSKQKPLYGQDWKTQPQN